jgi:hypothetical protein
VLHLVREATVLRRASIAQTPWTLAGFHGHSQNATLAASLSRSARPMKWKSHTMVDWVHATEARDRAWQIAMMMHPGSRYFYLPCARATCLPLAAHAPEGAVGDPLLPGTRSHDALRGPSRTAYGHVTRHPLLTSRSPTSAGTRCCSCIRAAKFSSARQRRCFSPSLTPAPYYHPRARCSRCTPRRARLGSIDTMSSKA